MKKNVYKQTKRLVAVLLVALLAFAAFGCAKKPLEQVRIAALKGPTGMGLAYMMSEDTSAYSIELYDAPDALTGKFISGEVDVAAVPINLASVLYNKTEGDVVMLCVNTLGVLYLLENGNEIQSLSDLAGKTVYATGQGSTPEYALSYLLEQNGLTDSVQVEFVGEHAALAAMVAANEVDIAMLPEPNVTATLMKNADTRVALDLNEAWNEASGTQIVQGCYIASRAYYESHPEEIKAFLTDYEKSVMRVNTEETAASVIAENGILPSEAVAKGAIPRCNIVCITGDEMVSSASAMLNVLFSANAKSVGGKLPNDDIYGG